jgi:vancomycin resistance protein YoaR
VTLAPGAVFSFNKTVGSWTADRGYVLAPVSFDGELEVDWGGGVCQTSTTLYNAALRAGCAITDSGHHSIPSDYVDLGFDAMVNYPSSDLKFVNPYDTPLYIKTFVTKKNNVYVMFFGAPLPDGETISVMNDVVYQGPPPITETVVDKDGTYADQVTYRDEEYQSMKPHPEIDVITYRVYKDKSGVEIKREKLREDHFKEVKGQIIIGKLERPVDSSKPVKTPEPGSVG